MRSYRLIGLTGQTGAGKSAVADYLSQRGFAVLNADKMVADVYRESPVCLKAVAACFGGDILRDDGSLDRPLLAKRAFSSPENTALLGKIVHPFVIAETLRLLKAQEAVKPLPSGTAPPERISFIISAICRKSTGAPAFSKTCC